MYYGKLCQSYSFSLLHPHSESFNTFGCSKADHSPQTLAFPVLYGKAICLCGWKRQEIALVWLQRRREFDVTT
jgi:hypothetical protein